MANWLDRHIKKNEEGYLKNAKGGIFVAVGDEFVRSVKGDDDPVDLVDISKDEFLDILLYG